MSRLLRLPSRHLGRKVCVWQHGWYGMPVLVFPSASGMAHEWQLGGALDALRPLIDAGVIKLYCTESNVADCWTHATDHPAQRLARHQAFDRYITDELVPFIRSDCNSPDIRIATTGVSLGGWYAVNTALRHPELFWWALSLSGRFSMEHMLDGWWSEDLYFHLPFSYVPNLSGSELERVRRQTSLTFVVGRGAHEGACLPETLAMARATAGRGIPTEADVWGRDVSNEWPWWCLQLRHHLGRRLAA